MILTYFAVSVQFASALRVVPFSIVQSTCDLRSLHVLLSYWLVAHVNVKDAISVNRVVIRPWIVIITLLFMYLFSSTLRKCSWTVVIATVIYIS